MTRARLLARRTFRSLEVRNYRLFFAGQLVSNTGTYMQVVAQSWLVLTLTDSGVALGITVALQFLPLLLFGVWGGLVADRSDKRRTLISTQIAFAVLALTLGTLVASGAVELWMVYVLAFLLGLVTVVDLPARQAFVTEMVGAEHLSNAVGLNSAGFNAARLLGPAAAGLIIDRAGVAPAFFLNAVSFVAVLTGLLAMRPDELFRLAPVRRARGQIREGLSYVWRTPVLRSTLVFVTVVSTFGFNFVVVLPLLARNTFGGGARLYGVLSAMLAMGSVGGALVTAARPAHRDRTLLGGAAATFGLLSLLAALAPGPVAEGLVLVPLGAALILFLATANTTLQLNSTPGMRGRVMALYGLVFLGSNPVGSPLLGWMCQRWGARAGLAFGGAVSLAVAVVFIARILPSTGPGGAETGGEERGGAALAVRA